MTAGRIRHVLLGAFVFVLILVTAALFSGAGQPYESKDSVPAPHNILLHKDGKVKAISKEAEFKEIVRLVNKRLKNARVNTNSAWSDSEVTALLDGVDSLEFDYLQLHNSSFEYYGPISLPPSYPKNIDIRSRIRYNRLFFPLTNSSDSDFGDFSASIFSFGGDEGYIIINDKKGAIVMQLNPIGSPDEILAYLKKAGIIS